MNRPAPVSRRTALVAAVPPLPQPPDVKSCGPVCEQASKDAVTAALGPKPRPAPTAEEAKAFVAKTADELQRLGTNSAVAQWVKSTFITDDTERMAATADEVLLSYQTQAVKDAARFKGVKDLDPVTGRMLENLRNRGAGPSDPAHRLELTALSTRLSGAYGKGKWCGADGKKEWGDRWRSGYDLLPDAFETETDRLWGQVKPLYDDLHCYVRRQLQKTYGKEKVPDGAPIPAHLLGNMWAQEWTHIYPLVEPYQAQASLDVDSELLAQKWDWKKMVQTGEGFYTSLGLDPLPASFWERSMFVKPRDREVICHASAWDVQNDNDLRIKMCIQPTEESLQTIHHELGHNYYQHSHYQLPYLLQGGAHDGFHEAIGDSIVLSMTPGYLKQLGLIQSVPTDEKGLSTCS